MATTYIEQSEQIARVSVLQVALSEKQKNGYFHGLFTNAYIVPPTFVASILIILSDILTKLTS